MIPVSRFQHLLKKIKPSVSLMSYHITAQATNSIVTPLHFEYFYFDNNFQEFIIIIVNGLNYMLPFSFQLVDYHQWDVQHEDQTSF